MNWPDTGPNLACPSCHGPIAYWVVLPRFKCHHCARTLLSNHRQVRLRLHFASVVSWALLSVVASTVLSASFVVIAIASAEYLLPIAFVGGWLSLKWLVKLTPETRCSEA